MLQHMPVVLPANCDAFVVSRAGSACAEHVAAYKTEKWQYVNRTQANSAWRAEPKQLLHSLSALSCGAACKDSCKYFFQLLSIESRDES